VWVPQPAQLVQGTAMRELPVSTITVRVWPGVPMSSAA
jgi:hypothetical protein